MKNTLAATLVAASALIVTAVQAATPEVEALLQAAQKEGAVYSVGMPNTWANWVKTWSDLQTKYKIKTQDTDMASAEQISKFMAEGENATSDIGDVGFEFGEIAKKRGYAQVLWLDGVEQKYVEEVGSMNIFFVINGVVVTPMLGGSILPGITRKSTIELLKKRGYKVEERLVSVDEVVKAADDGTLDEIFGTGTAAVVSPVGSFGYHGKKYTVGDGKLGKITKYVYDELTGIQTGRIEDDFGWVERII